MNEEYGVDFIARCMAAEALENSGDEYSLVAGDNIEIVTDEEEKTKTISAEVPEVNEVPDVGSADNGRILKATYSGGEGSYAWSDPETFSQEQANWTENDNTKVSYIQNKPTLAAVATSGDYNDLINTPPALPEIGPDDGGKLLQAVVTGTGVPSPNLLVQEEKTIPSGYNGGTIEYSFLLMAGIPGGSDAMNTAEYNQFVYAYADYNAQDRALDGRTQSYANSQFFAKLPAGSYKLVFEMVNGTEDAVIWYKSVLEEDPYMALVDDNNTVIVSDNTFNQITGRPQWTQKIYTFTVNDETNVGLFYKLYPNNFRAYIVPDDTEFVAFTNSQFIETGHPTFSGTTGWAPYGKTGYDWASVQAQVQSDWAQSDTTAVDYIKNKPTIPAAQVNADWNASSGVAEILNKPSLGTAAAAATTDFATAAQGTKADTALQPGDLTGYATQTWVGQQGYLTSADEVPAVGSSDDGKVLKATYFGGTGSYAWATEYSYTLPYASQNAKGGVRAWTTTEGGETVLNIATEDPTP